MEKNGLRMMGLFFGFLVCFLLTSWDSSFAGSQISGEYGHTLSIKSDGTLWAWGWNNYGQLGDGTTTDRNTPVQVSGGGNTWGAVAAGIYHTVALKSDGTLWAWGFNQYGQLGIGTSIDKNTPVQVSGGGNTWVAIAAGNYHTVALKSDGTLWAWGRNDSGQLGDGTTTDRNTPVQVSGGGNTWVAVAAGNYHTVALKSDGTLWAWGYNGTGQLGDGTTTNRNTPIQVSGGGNTWVAIAAGFAHTVALKSDGTLWSWGYNGTGQLGDGTTADRNTPVQVSGGGNTWVAIAAGFAHTVALKSDGTLWAWGFNQYGQLGDGTNTDTNTPVQIGPDNIRWVRGVAAGLIHSLGLKSNGTLWAWGNNGDGQLGDGTTAQRTSPVQIGSDNKWVMVAAGDYHSLGLKSDGTLWAWGRNDYGQLGDGSTTYRYSPVQIGSDSKWVMVSAGWRSSLSLKSDGTLWSWGYNGNGQLGDGTTTHRYSPVQIGDNRWVMVYQGGGHCLGLKSDGTLWAWGDNTYGQLGDGTIVPKTSPIQIGSDNKWIMVFARGANSLGLKSDGTLWAWGLNNYGQLGNGTTTNSASPIQVGSDNKWVRISSYGNFSLGLKSDGTLWAWGFNNYGQLGDGTQDERRSPVQIGSDNRWIKVSCGGWHSLGLKSDGTLWAWGYNAVGQLGDGTTLDKLSPLLITNADLVDFDGDGATDVAAFHLSSDQFFTDYSGNMGQYGWGGSDSYPIVWDYDGNGTTDISVYHIPTNQWFVRGVPGDNLGAFGWGADEAVPVPGDYNGDGIIERAFYHWPTNRWFIEGGGGSFTAYDFGWGGADSIPIAADYDGDGTTDMMLYHMPTNQWFVYGIGNLGQFGWNGSECLPVPGDWDGDGRTEIGIYHVPSNQWFWRDQDGTDYFLGQYGWEGIQSFPIPGDYNGDGIMERAFYRPSENRWFIEGEPDFVWGYGGSNFMPITSQMAIYNWFRFVLGMFQ